jgi:hypothetical protein
VIKRRKEGRQVVYSLTAAGKKGLAEASRYFLQAFGDIAEDVKVKVIIIKGDDCSC